MANPRKIECSKDILGKGGFATVYKGRYENRDVAVKRMLIEDVDEREEEFLTNYAHRNILKLFYAEEDDNFRQVKCRT